MTNNYEHPDIAIINRDGELRAGHDDSLRCDDCGEVINPGERYGQFYDDVLCAECAKKEFDHMTACEKEEAYITSIGMEVKISV